jgi:hypothetical protein
MKISIEFSENDQHKNCQPLLILTTEWPSGAKSVLRCGGSQGNGGGETEIFPEPGQIIRGGQEPEVDWHHSELAFWVEAGLNAKMVTKWMEEFGIPIEQMIQALKHAAYDIPLQQEKRKEKIDSLNWFYAALKRYGTYRRRVGYKPVEEILLERAMAKRDDKEPLPWELVEEEPQGGMTTAEELAFQNIISNPTTAEYWNLKVKASPLGTLQLTGKMLEAAMRTAFFNSLSTPGDTL